MSQLHSSHKKKPLHVVHFSYTGSVSAPATGKWTWERTLRTCCRCETSAHKFGTNHYRVQAYIPCTAVENKTNLVLSILIPGIHGFETQWKYKKSSLLHDVSLIRR